MYLRLKILLQRLYIRLNPNSKFICYVYGRLDNITGEINYVGKSFRPKARNNELGIDNIIILDKYYDIEQHWIAKYQTHITNKETPYCQEKHNIGEIVRVRYPEIKYKYRKKPVINIITNKKYPSIVDACRLANTTSSIVRYACKNKRGDWRWVKEE